MKKKEVKQVQKTTENLDEEGSAYFMTEVVIPESKDQNIKESQTFGLQTNINFNNEIGRQRTVVLRNYNSNNQLDSLNKSMN
jgi:hypothetical protein